LKWKFEQTYFPHLNGDGAAHASVEEAFLQIGFKIVKIPKIVVESLAKSIKNDKISSIVKYFPDLKSQLEGSSTIDANVDRGGVILGGSSTNSSTKIDSNSSNNSSTNSSTQIDSKEGMWGDIDEWRPVLLLSRYTSVYQSLYPSINQLTHLSIYLSIYLCSCNLDIKTLDLGIYLSMYLSMYLYIDIYLSI
jgi:hypothetical protein